MSMIADVLDREQRPAYVTFERIPVEDKAASLSAGHYVAKDVDYVNITPPYSKDIFKQKVQAWMDQLKADVANERMPKTWADGYEAAYRAWQTGQELPLSGTAIRGWGVISPAQQETLVKMNIRTVEDLAGVNDEGIRRIGMGAVELKQKAIAWLAQLKDKGPLTQEMAALRTENANLRGDLDRALDAIERLQSYVVKPATEAIAAEDILEDESEQIVNEPPIVKRGPGRPRKAS